MLMPIPKFKLEESIWFLTEKDLLKYGKIQLVSVAFSLEESNVYYHVVDDSEMNHVVNEKQVVEKTYNILHPKYNIGDIVNYSFTATNRKRSTTNGTIEKIEIHITQEKTIEIGYIMDDDPDYIVLEDEIIGFSDDNFIGANIIDATGGK